MTVARRAGPFAAILLAVLAAGQALAVPIGCGSSGGAGKPSIGRVVLDEAAAAIIVKHIRRACLRITELASMVAADSARRQLGGVSRRLARISAGILRTHPGLADRDVSDVRTKDAKALIGPATARYLRWALKDAGDLTRIKALANSPCSDASEAPARICIQTLIDLSAEIGFAVAPVHTAYPGLLKLSMDELRSANRKRPREVRHDEAFRKNAPPKGSVSLSPVVVAYILPLMVSLEKQEKGCHLAMILWSQGGRSKSPDDPEWIEQAPGVVVGFDACDRVPSDVVHTIDGLRMVFMGDGPDRFKDKIVDLDGKQLILRDR